jgi:hypothetical protein
MKLMKKRIRNINERNGKSNRRYDNTFKNNKKRKRVKKKLKIVRKTIQYPAKI